MFVLFKLLVIIQIFLFPQLGSSQHPCLQRAISCIRRQGSISFQKGKTPPYDGSPLRYLFLLLLVKNIHSTSEQIRTATFQILSLMPLPVGLRRHRKSVLVFILVYNLLSTVPIEVLLTPVPVKGFEPPRFCKHQILSLVCLPIPSHGHLLERRESNSESRMADVLQTFDLANLPSLQYLR